MRAKLSLSSTYSGRERCADPYEFGAVVYRPAVASGRVELREENDTMDAATYLGCTS